MNQEKPSGIPLNKNGVVGFQASNDHVAASSASVNEDKIKSQWNQLTGKLKTQWSKLTNDDLKVGEGSSEYLSGKLQGHYSMSAEEADTQIQEFRQKL